MKDDVLLVWLVLGGVVTMPIWFPPTAAMGRWLVKQLTRWAKYWES